MVHNYVRKTQPRYAVEVMEAAVKAVCSCGMPFRKAAVEFGIPKTTLAKHVQRAKRNIPIRVKGGYKFYSDDSIPSLDQNDAGPDVSEPKINTNKPAAVGKTNPKRSCRPVSKGCPAVTATRKRPSLPKKNANEENEFGNCNLTEDTLSFVKMIGVKLDQMTKKARASTQLKICQIVFESELDSLANEEK